MSNEEQKIGKPNDNSFTLAEVVKTLWSSRKLVVYVVGAVTVAAIGFSLLMPDFYKSSAVLLPETDRSKLASLGGLSDLAALAGVNTGEASLVKLYPTIIKSEAVLRNVIYARYQTKAFGDSVNLIQFWGIEAKTRDLEYERALKALRDELDVTMDNKTNVVSLSIETKEAQLSADIINNVTSALDKYMRTKRTTNASEQRKWIEARLVEVKNDLDKSENTLREFREKNRRIADSPQLLLEQDRLAREVQINATLYIELKKQYELVKIEEIKNIPIINVMDTGRAAALKSKPKRSVIVAASFLLSLIGSLGYVFGEQKYGVLVRTHVNLIRSQIMNG